MDDQTPYDSKLPDPVKPQSSGGGLISGFLGTARAVLVRPREFFPEMPVEGGLLGPYFFFWLCTLAFFLISLFMNIMSGSIVTIRAFLLIFLTLAMPFVSAAILHFFLRNMLGTRGSYEATFRVVCYSSAVNLFAWIPIVGILFQFYEVYLSALGLSVVHRTTVGRALLAVIAAALAIFLVVFMAFQQLQSP
jgi:hypothetical protein